MIKPVTRPSFFCPQLIVATDCIENAVSPFLKIIFELNNILINIVTIPLRFVGSKFLTLPELVIRASLYVKDRLCHASQDQFHKIVTSTGYSLSMEKLPLKLAEESLKFARLDATVHTNNFAWLPSNCTMIADYIHDELKVALIEESSEGKTRMHVVFGAKGAEGTKDFNTKNILSVAWNMLGGISSNYFKAESAYLHLKRTYPHLFKDREVVLSGLCLGASLAQFVALRQNLKAHCLNSVGLSPSAQWHIGRKSLKKASRLITHISARGDFASAPQGLIKVINYASVLFEIFGLRTMGNFGNRYVIPHAKEHANSLDKIHCLVMSSLARYLDPHVKIKKDGRLDGGIAYLTNRDALKTR